MAIVEKIAIFQAESGTHAQYMGSFILDFTQDSDGYLVSSDNPVILDIPGISPTKIEFKLINKNKIEISYEVSSCGGKSQLKCGTRFTKLYSINSQKVKTL
ncbi:hypothetical protein COV25_01845 [candidate division WWE3 bacterium CG10_big_fil_rev_8_21_14_0_10_35_32]|nr:MAG: hypothetical protein COV25_01845 [candidate division WWE3 bacterium CG10_big_fil_rev_8_21_14_0_10_35_32]